MKSTRLATREREFAERPLEIPDSDAGHPVTPQQYYDIIGRHRTLDGESRLLFAVLEDAIRCYLTTMNSASRSRRREFDEVKAWVDTRGEHDLFAFDSICRMFEIEPDMLRRQLNHLHISDFPRRRMRTVGRRTPMSVPE